MSIRVLLFAQLQDLAGADCLDVELDGANSVRGLLNVIKPQVPDDLWAALNDQSIMVSVNRQYAGWDGRVKDGDEVGFLPPVSGG